ncbi:aldo/keto reductase [Paenibacillus cymbidii]|uniref:aldo/keto reductase n=1 Tax=Paenibacillus cymbidii TaxID=1639034 RepID=UPI00108105EB|nr:aldo/keto reductase [Paenibacillus cymbidii]
MQYRTFGKTDWKVSEIAFGGWQLGGDFGPVDDAESVRTLHAAWERGINFVDTAQMYGRGHSEEVIGRALKEWTGEHIYIATKVQPVQWPRATETDPSMEGRYPREYVRSQCEDSLRRLGLETIDLYQLHGWFPQGIEQTEWYDTLSELRKEGKIREFGVSIRDYRPQDGARLAASGKAASQQVVYNLFEQRPAEQLFPACRDNGVAIIARVPFDEGSLIGNWSADTYATFGERDVRRVYFKGGRFAKTLDRVNRLKADIAAATGESEVNLAEIALRFCLDDSAVSCAIPGMKNVHEVDLNVRVSDGRKLPAEVLEVLSRHKWPRNYHNPDEE